MFSNPFRNHQKALSDQVRQEWYDFESSWFKSQQAAMERRCAEKFKELDKAFQASTASSNPPPSSKTSSKKRAAATNNHNSAATKAAVKEHENNKYKARAELRKELVLKAREEWQRRLTEKGLQDEHWTEMSAEEQAAVSRTLGGDFEDDAGDDGEAEMTLPRQAPVMSTTTNVLSSLPPPSSAAPLASASKPSLSSLQTLHTNIPPVPSLSSATRSTNASSTSTSAASTSYTVVNPSSLGKPSAYQDDDDEDEDETSPFEDLSFVYDVMRHKSDRRDAYDTPTGSSSFSGSGWSTELSLSTQTSHTSSPEQPAHRTIPPVDSSMPGGWFASVPVIPGFAKEKEKDIAATPTTSSVKGSKSGWGVNAIGSKATGKVQQQKSTDTASSSSAHASSAPTTSSTSAAMSASSRTRISGPYIGPDLNTTDDFPFSSSTSHNTTNSTVSTNSSSDLSSEEADFEAYKMSVRIAKIHEFHAEAAAADEGLIREIFMSRKMFKLGLYDERIDMNDVARASSSGNGKGVKERRGGTGKTGVGGGDGGGGGMEEGGPEWIDLLRKRREKRCWEEEIRRIEEHERTMVNLRKVKEDERRVLVEEERQRRREAIKSQSQQRLSSGAQEAIPKPVHAPVKSGGLLSSRASVLSTNSTSSSASGSSGNGMSTTSTFYPPQISLESSASSFASTLSSFNNPFNANASSTALFTPTPSSVNPFTNASQHSSSSNKVTSVFPPDDEFVFDESKIASLLASQAQMAQKFDGWMSGSGSKSGSPRNEGEGATPLPPTSPPSAPNNVNGVSPSAILNGKNAPVPVKAPSPPSAPEQTDVKKAAEKEKDDGKKIGSSPPSAPAITVTSSSGSESKNAASSKLSKAAKKKGKKGQAATPASEPSPSPASAPVKETPSKGKLPETVAPSKGKVAEPVKDLPAPAATKTTPSKVDAKPASKKDEQSQASGLSSSIKSLWGKKDDPVPLAKAKEELPAPISAPALAATSQHHQQQSKATPTPTRWKVSLFDDDTTSSPSRTTLDSTPASTSKHTLQPPAAQTIWHPNSNAGVARSTSDQPAGGLKVPDTVGVTRAASDQPPHRAAAQHTFHPEIWLPPQAKQSQPLAAASQPQPWDRRPTNASSMRTRRMSEPAPPSPVDPAFFAEVAKVNDKRSAELQGILKKGKSAAGGKSAGIAAPSKPSARKNAVVVEDVSDDEEDQDDVGGALASDSRYIMEEISNIAKPKPSVAGKMFDTIIDYEEDDSGSSTTEVPSSFGDGKMGANEGLSWDTLAKSAKAKHVRWTPSTLGNASPVSFAGDEEGASMNIESFLQNAASKLSQVNGGAAQAGHGRSGNVPHGSGFKGWGQPALGHGGERRENGTRSM